MTGPARALILTAALGVAMAACILETSGVPGAAATGGASTTASTGGAATTASTGGGVATTSSTSGGACGDGTIEPPEQCDGKDLSGATCASIGYPDAGALACQADCTFDPAPCLVDWYDPAWTRRRPVTIHHDKVTADLGDFAVLLRFTDSAFLAAIRSDAADVIVTAGDGKTLLPFEIERPVQPSAGEILVWARVPALSASADTDLFVYYGDPGAKSQAAPAAVWKDDQAVWHLGEDPSQTGGKLADSTGGHDGAAQGDTPVAGQIGRAQTFNGTSDYVEAANPGGIVLGDADCTISAWIKTSSSAAMGILLKTNGAVHEMGDKAFGVSRNGDKKLGLDQGWVGFIEGSHAIADGKWHYVVFTQQHDVSGSNEGWDLYLDGAHEAGQQQETTLPDVAGHTVRIGFGANQPTSNPDYFSGDFSGVIDEVRVGAKARSADWVATSYADQHDPGAFATLGPEQALP